MEKIAQRTGVSRATLYRWWDGKGQLVIEALMAQRKHPPRAITDDFEAGLEELVACIRVAKSVGAPLLEEKESLIIHDRQGELLQVSIPLFLLSVELFPQDLGELTL
jgi:AcrR family transcriptional regulator